MAVNQPSVVSSKDDLRQQAAGQSGDATLAPRSLSLGQLVHLGDAGKIEAQWVRVTGTAATVYAVPHTLGFVPGFCKLMAYWNSSNPGTLLNDGPADYDKWSASECKVRIGFSLGGISGSVMWFLVGARR